MAVLCDGGGFGGGDRHQFLEGLGQREPFLPIARYARHQLCARQPLGIADGVESCGDLRDFRTQFCVEIGSIRMLHYLSVSPLPFIFDNNICRDVPRRSVVRYGDADLKTTVFKRFISKDGWIKVCHDVQI